jgi:hypothetical protein
MNNYPQNSNIDSHRERNAFHHILNHLQTNQQLKTHKENKVMKAKYNFKMVLTLGCLALASSGFATTVSSAVKKHTGKPVGADEADQVITNRMMRASTGSLSNWSITSSWGYSAGSIEKPLEAERPNLTEGGDIVAIQSLNADVGVSYRLNPLNRLTFGVGLNSIAPFNNSINTNNPNAQKEFDDNQGRVDINNPNVAYTHLFKVMGLQGWVSFSGLKYTTGAMVDRGYDYYAQGAMSTMYEFGKSGFSAGVYAQARRNFFNKSDDILLGRQAESIIALLPQAEYVINDTFNLRTIIRPWWYQNTRAQTADDYTRYNFTQSAGLGISVTRDVFLYPNIQWEPENMTAERTNIGLSANINLF